MKLGSMNETGHKALRAFARTSRHWQYFWINANMKNHANLGLLDPGLQSCMLQNRVLNLACFIAICHYASTWKLWFWGAPILIVTWLHKVFQKVEHLQHSTPPSCASLLRSRQFWIPPESYYLHQPVPAVGSQVEPPAGPTLDLSSHFS